MEILVLGCEGMLGSFLVQQYGYVGATRRPVPAGDPRIGDVDITNPDSLHRVLDQVTPRVVINCAGIVKSEVERVGEERVMQTNGEAPHMLADIARDRNCYVIHISTDCVFDGSRGNRLETDKPDATDLYGRSKALGELDRSGCVTLRTSFIGRDPTHGRGLVEWLLAATDMAPGFRRMMWSGLSTHELGKAINWVALDENEHNGRDLAGIFHVSGPVISKADLLEELAQAYQMRCTIERIDGPPIDRTLYDHRFSSIRNYVPPSWNVMAKELARVDP